MRPTRSHTTTRLGSVAITNCRPIVLASRSPAKGALHSTTTPMPAASGQPTAASTRVAIGAQPSSSPTATTSPAQVPARQLLRAEASTCVVITVIALIALALIAGADALADPTLWVFAAAVTLSTICSAVRALAERAGQERRGFVLEWALPLGAIAGALIRPHGALGPATGILVGLIVGFVGLLPVVLSHRSKGTGTEGQAAQVEVVDRGRTRVLLFDALVYTNR